MKQEKLKGQTVLKELKKKKTWVLTSLSGSKKDQPPCSKKPSGSSTMVFMILVQFKDWTPSVYLMSQELRKKPEELGELCCCAPACVSLSGRLLQPLLDGVQRVHRHGVDHGDLFVVVLVDDDHVEVLQVELNALKVDQLHLVEGHHERRLKTRI